MYNFDLGGAHAQRRIVFVAEFFGTATWLWLACIIFAISLPAFSLGVLTVSTAEIGAWQPDAVRRLHHGRPAIRPVGLAGQGRRRLQGFLHRLSDREAVAGGQRAGDLRHRPGPIHRLYLEHLRDPWHACAVLCVALALMLHRSAHLVTVGPLAGAVLLSLWKIRTAPPSPSANDPLPITLSPRRAGAFITAGDDP